MRTEALGKGRRVRRTNPSKGRFYAIGRAIAIYYCPTRRQPVPDPGRPPQQWQGQEKVGRAPPNTLVGKTDYAGSMFDGNRSGLVRFRVYQTSRETTRAGFVDMGWPRDGAIVATRGYANASLVSSTRREPEADPSQAAHDLYTAL